MAETITSLKINIEENTKNASQEIDKLINRLEALRDTLSKGFTSKNVTKALKAITNASSSVATNVGGAVKDANDIAGKVKVTGKTGTLDPDESPMTSEKSRKNIKKTTKSVNDLYESFVRIAKYRLLRTILKEITDGFKTGTENMYKWSRMNGTTFASSMDSMASSLLYVKNSLGALSATFLEGFAPVLEKLSNAFVKIIEFVSKLVGALSGRGYYYKALKKDTKALKDLNSQLLKFDDLNIISSKNSEEWADSFEQVELDGFFKELSDAISKVNEALGLDSGELIGWGAVALGALSVIKKLISLFTGKNEALETQTSNTTADATATEGLTSKLSSLFGVVGALVGVGGLGLLGDALGDLQGKEEGLTEGLGVLASSFGTVDEKQKEVSEKLRELEGVIDRLQEKASELGTQAEATASTISKAFSDNTITETAFDNVYKSYVDLKDLLAKNPLVVSCKLEYSTVNSTSKNSGLTYNDALSEKLSSKKTTSTQTSSLTAKNYTEFKETLVSSLLGSLMPNISFQTTAGTKLWESLRNIVFAMGSMSMLIPLLAFADGGYPSQGSLFLAGEIPGQAEMFGNINGKTGVASGNEITGIREAVEQTGDTTNSLLSQLVRINNAMLQNGSGFGNPSASAGRWISQSLNAYQRVTG